MARLSEYLPVVTLFLCSCKKYLVSLSLDASRRGTLTVLHVVCVKHHGHEHHGNQGHWTQDTAKVLFGLLRYQ